MTSSEPLANGDGLPTCCPTSTAGLDVRVTSLNEVEGLAATATLRRNWLDVTVTDDGRSGGVRGRAKVESSLAVTVTAGAYSDELVLASTAGCPVYKEKCFQSLFIHLAKMNLIKVLPVYFAVEWQWYHQWTWEPAVHERSPRHHQNHASPSEPSSTVLSRFPQVPVLRKTERWHELYGNWVDVSPTHEITLWRIELKFLTIYEEAPTSSSERKLYVYTTAILFCFIMFYSFATGNSVRSKV